MLNVQRFVCRTCKVNNILEIPKIKSIGTNRTTLFKSNYKSKRTKPSRISKKYTNAKMEPDKVQATAGAECSAFTQNGSGQEAVSKQFNSSQNSSKENIKKIFQHWEDTESSPTRSVCTNVTDGNVLTVMSYNILAQDLLESHSYLYVNHERRALNWEFRLSRLRNHILNIKPDILCLQEVQIDHLDIILDNLKELKFNHIFKKKTGSRTDGCAIFYNKNQFTLLERHSVEYHQPQIEQLNRDNVAIVAKMCFKSDPGACFVVATTHLLYNPRRQDVRLAQIQVLLAELDKISYNGYSSQRTLKRLPIILTGDFNLQPWSAPHRLITMGNLIYHNLTMRQLECPFDNFCQLTGNNFLPFKLGITDNCQHFNNSRLRNTEIPNQNDIDHQHSEEDNLNPHPGLFGSGYLSHGLKLTSVYSHKKPNGQREATTFQEKWITVDYIFYSQHHKSNGADPYDGYLKLLSRYSLPSVDECHSMGLIPNSELGSDHLSLAARFLLCTPKRFL